MSMENNCFLFHLLFLNTSYQFYHIFRRLREEDTGLLTEMSRCMAVRPVPKRESQFNLTKICRGAKGGRTPRSRSFFFFFFSILFFFDHNHPVT